MKEIPLSSAADLCTLLPFQSAAKALEIFSAERPILKLLDDVTLDGTLSFAFNSLGIVEIYGPGGAGKSTLGMQLLANFLNSQQDKCACVLHSGRLSYKRMEQIFSERFGAQSLSMLSRVVFQQMGDIESQAACISSEYFTNLLENAPRPVQFILVDSIGANFRMHSANRWTAFLINTMAAALHDFCYRQHAYVFCINEVSSVFSNEATEQVSLQSASCASEATPSFSFGSEAYKPVLALSWSNAVNTRIEMSLRERADASEFVGPERVIRVRRCPDCAPVEVWCRLSNRGVESLAENAPDDS